MAATPIAFLCGHRKSGTTLFNNLFDGHPQLSVYPIDLNLLYAYFPRFTDASASREQLLARIKRVVFDEFAEVPQIDGVVQPGALEAEFRRRLDGGSPLDMRLVLRSLLEAYASLTGTAQSARYLVAKETSIELYASEIARWFPDCRFLHLIRDPRDNFAAIRAGLAKKYQGYGDDQTSLLFSVLVRNLWGIRMAKLNQRLLGEDRYRIVRFEDLVARTEDTMRDAAAWLGIDFVRSMTQPSVSGRPTAGNSLAGVAFSGVSAVHVDKWRERISAEEAAMIEFGFGEEMRAFGYLPEAGDAQIAASVGEHYKRINYKYFYFDRFGD